SRRARRPRHPSRRERAPRGVRPRGRHAGGDRAPDRAGPPPVRADHRRARERRRAVEETLATARDGATCTVYPGKFTVEHGRQATLEILASEPRATAIIAGGNMLMQGALLTLREAGIKLGRDLSFVGCDDVIVSEVHEPPISVVRRDIPAVGVAAAELLLADLEPVDGDESPPREIVLPTEFIARPSCAPPA